MPYQAVIFDLDGTILNTIDDLADSANFVLAAQGYPTHPTERYKTFVGNGIPKLIERMLPPGTAPDIIQRTFADFGARYAAHKLDKTAPYEGIPDLLTLLRQHGFKLAVLSNKQHDLSEAIVTQIFGEDAFDVIQGMCDRFPRKPDPAACFDVMNRLDVHPGEVLYVGDSNVDMRTAANAGLVKCGVTWGFRSEQELRKEGADFIAHTPQNIAHIALGHTGGSDQ
ncbi:MAG: HAD family hydrolase [Clostridia bacterium]|nr:HAD family hydrolase [Clostridia bacterium]MBQ1554943.1 HAD family hydrolase [Clostridia bacterium]